MPLVYDGLNEPVEIAPGRGDLRFSSVPLDDHRQGAVLVAGDTHVSFARLFQTQPMVASNVGWLMRQALRVPLKTYRRTGDDSRDRLRDGDHPLATAVARPWDGGTASTLVMGLLGSLLVHGNALAEVIDGASGRFAFRQPDWRFSKPIRPWRDAISGWELDRDDASLHRTVAASRVLHVAYWSPAGPLGVSPLQQLGVTLNIEDAAQRHQKALLANGARTPSVITVDKEFIGIGTEETRERILSNLRSDITALHAGPDNAGRPPLLPPGLDWKAAGQTAVEADLVRQRVVARPEACSVYGVLPGALGFFDTGAPDLAEQRRASILEGLVPALVLIEAAINGQIARSLLREDDLYVEFDLAAVLRGDPLQEIESLRQAISSAQLTPNEARAVLNRPRSQQAGMDDFYLPRNNLWPLSVPYPEKGMGGEGPDTETTDA